MANDTDSGNANNPYSDMPQAVSVPSRTRPTGVTVTAVLSIIAGILGCLVGLGTLVNTMVGPRMAQAFNQPGPYEQAQKEMNTSIQRLTSKYMAANVAVSIGTMALAAVLFVGGIGAIPGRGWARKLLLRAFLLGMILECVKIVPAAMMQLEMLPVMEQYFEKIASTPAPGGGAPPPMVGTFAKVGMLVGLAFWIGWAAIKLGLYAWGMRYLGRPHVKDYFEEPVTTAVPTSQLGP